MLCSLRWRGAENVDSTCSVAAAAGEEGDRHSINRGVCTPSCRCTVGSTFPDLRGATRSPGLQLLIWSKHLSCVTPVGGRSEPRPACESLSPAMFISFPLLALEEGISWHKPIWSVRVRWWVVPSLLELYAPQTRCKVHGHAFWPRCRPYPRLTSASLTQLALHCQINRLHKSPRLICLLT